MENVFQVTWETSAGVFTRMTLTEFSAQQTEAGKFWLGSFFQNHDLERIMNWFLSCI